MSKYLLWDMDEEDLEYDFTWEEIGSLEILDMINLNLRAGTATYKLPIGDNTKAGKKITIRNKDFGLTNTGNYGGVKFILDDKDNAYWFFFKEQFASFFFDGSSWIIEEPPQTNINMNILKDFTEYGYLDIKDYLNKKNKILFNNMDMSSFKKDITGLFFRHQSKENFGLVQDAAIKKHKHILPKHKHSFIMEELIATNVTSDLNYILAVAGFFAGSNWHWAWRIFVLLPWLAYQMITNPIRFPAIADWYFKLKDKDSKESDLNQLSFVGDNWRHSCESITNMVPLKKVGKEETRPKNIQGVYVIKAW